MTAAAPTTADVWMIVAIAFLFVVLVFLSVAEMSLSRMSKPKAQALADTGQRGGSSLVGLVSRPERWVNPLLLSVNVAQTIQATLTGVVAGRLFGAPGVAIGVVLNVVVFFVFAEAVPKTYAVQHTDRAALGTARLTSVLVGFAPLRLVSRSLIGLTNVIVKGKGLEQGPFVSESELLGIVETAAEDEVIEEEERELIESIIEFGDTVAREIMVPRPDIVTIPHDATISMALDIALEHGYSRIPVLNTDHDNDVVGLIIAKDLMRAERNGLGAEALTDLLRPVRFVPENKAVNRLMREMQAEKFHLALVADEYGALAGLITLEDCLEELVGEIVDEHDLEDEEVEHLSDGSFLVDGGMAIGDLNELIGTSIPDVDFDTVGGFLFGTLEHVPEPGEWVVREGWRLTAKELEGRRIRQVLVTLEPEVGPSEE